MTADLDVTEIIRLYESGESGDEIAIRFGVSHPTIKQRLLSAGVKLRTQSEAAQLRVAKYGVYKRTEEHRTRQSQRLKEFYQTKEGEERKELIGKMFKGKPKSAEHKAKIKTARARQVTRTGYKHSEDTLEKLSRTWFKKGHVSWIKGLTKETDTRIAKYSGENHPCWRGGVSTAKYGKAFTELLKESVRGRDAYTCQECGVEQDVHIINDRTEKLSVHHIDENKKNNNERNLISLCRSCHMKVRHYQAFWQPRFEKKIESIYLSLKDRVCQYDY